MNYLSVRDVLQVVRFLLVGCLLSALACGGCLKKSELFCDENTPCTDPALPFCDLTGEFPASDGIGKTCIPSPFADAGPTADASTVDAASVDPPVINFQPADLVLGQSDLMSRDVRARSATSIGGPTTVFTDGSRLWVGEYSGSASRVMQWDVMPQVNDQAANLAIGQPSLTSSEFESDENSLMFIFAADSDGTRVVIADPFRVLLWEPIPVVSGVNALRVLGQPELTTNQAGSGQSGFAQAEGVCVGGGRIAVAARGQNRVMIWNTIPTSNGVAADLVLGQPNFAQTLRLDPPTRSSMAGPRHLACTDQRLIVTDADNHRVLIWNSWPTANGQPADVVVGQPTGELGEPNQGGAAGGSTLHFPTSAHVARGSLFVSETGNQRILVFSPIPSTDGEAAKRVLGQPNFLATDAAFDLPASASRFGPTDIAVTDDEIWIADSANRRVLRVPFL